MYDFAKRPLWILSHILVAVGVLAMIRLGIWQMSRWQSEQDNKERIEAGMDAAPVPLEDLLGNLGNPTETSQVPEDVEYRRVTATGTWDLESQVLVRNRSLGGAPGGWLLTPLVLDDGSEVAVLRGWVPLDAANAGAPYPGTDPASGEAVVTGVVQRTQQGGGLGAKDPDTGVLDTLARVDLDRYTQQLEVPLAPVWIVAQNTEPPQPTDGLSVVEVEVPEPSQNFSYMMQWWFFSLIAVGGYLLILRKVAQTRDDSRGSGKRLSDVPEDDPPEVVGV
ncbi:MAG: SURF1 family protein [Microthrixaceae bacterium]